MSDDPVVKTTIRLPESLLRRAKIRAIKDGTTFQDLVIVLLTQHLRGERQ